MSFANDILDAIEIMVKQVVEDNTTKIYTGVCKTIGVNNCVLTINGKDNTVKYYGGVPVVGTVYQVFIPFGNMSAAFIIVPGSGGESGGSGVDSVNGMTGDVVLNAADVGLGNVDNIKQYSASNPPPYPVASVNGKTGGVNLTASDVGAAPAGYGLGTNAKDISGVDFNTVRDNGWYMFATAGENRPYDQFGYSYMLVAKRSNENLTQIVFIGNAADYAGCIVKRVNLSGTWYPWEWVNPPMYLGVEYRTTERYLGKPVYVRVVDCGSVEANTLKQVSGIGSNVKDVVRFSAIGIEGKYGETIVLPSDTGSLTLRAFVNRTIKNNMYVTFKCDQRSLSEVKFTLWYTKTTD